MSDKQEQAKQENGVEKRERRMNAYYYGFMETGVDSVDDILEQIAISGKMYHHTESWTDPNEYDDNKSCVDRIQESATKAAADYTALRSQRAELVKKLSTIVRCYGVGYKKGEEAKFVEHVGPLMVEAAKLLAALRSGGGE